MASSVPLWSSGPMRAAVATGKRGEVVRLARLARGWTQSELGKRCGGYSPSVISRLESGAQPLTDIDMLRRLAAALEIPPEYLGLNPDAKERRTNVRAAIPRPRVDSPSVRMPAQLPTDIPEFVGRETELRQLDALLVSHRRQPASAVVISAVSGTAGVGKTALAVHWAHRVADRFSDGQLYVNLRGFEPSGVAMDPAEAIRGFLEALGVEPEGIPAELDAQAALYRSLLAGKRMLIVLDNARDTNQVRPLLPGAAGCLVVITSRNVLSGLVTREGARPVGIDLLTNAEAKQLLERRLSSARIATEPKAVGEILSACAGLPLALAVVAARAETHPEFSLASLAAELRESYARLDFLTAEGPDTDVRAVFSWSYDQLGSKAKRLFRLLGLHPGPDATTAMIASMAAVSLRLSRALLTELTTAHLVVERMPGRFGFHDLLRVYAHELVLANDSFADRQTAEQRVLDHYLQSAFAADRQLRPSREPIALAPSRIGVIPEPVGSGTPAMDWFVAEHRALLVVVEQAAAAGLDEAASDLAWTLDTYLYRRGHYRDSAKIWRIALEAGLRLEDRPRQARAHRMFARAEMALANLDSAQAHLRGALGILIGLDDAIGQAKTHAMLAQVFEQYGEYRKALECAQKAVDLYREAGNRDGHARGLNDKGWYQAKLGEYVQAMASCQKALAMHRELGNEEAEANTLDSLAYVHFQLGNYRDAIEAYEKALSLFAELGDRRNWAVSLAYLGDTYQSAGSHRAALDSWEQALLVLEEIGHPNAATVRMKASELRQALDGSADGSAGN